jgi:hypothetical protein
MPRILKKEAGLTAGLSLWMNLILELFANCCGYFVCSILGGCLQITDRLLDLAFGLLDCAFNLKPIVANHLADALLDLANSLICKSGRLVACASHDFCSCVDQKYPPISGGLPCHVLASLRYMAFTPAGLTAINDP